MASSVVIENPDPGVYESEHYKIVLGAMQDNSPTVYLVQNKATGVIEFAHEVQALTKEWVDHFTDRLNGLPPEECGQGRAAVPAPQLVNRTRGGH